MTLVRIERLRTRMHNFVERMRRNGGVGLPTIREEFWTSLASVAEGPGGDAFLDALEASLDAAEAQVRRELVRGAIHVRGRA